MVNYEQRWLSIAAFAHRSCAIRADYTLWCWGLNTNSELGDGTATNRKAPVRIGSESGWTSLATSAYDSCGIQATGKVLCWVSMGGCIPVLVAFENAYGIYINVSILASCRVATPQAMWATGRPPPELRRCRFDRAFSSTRWQWASAPSAPSPARHRLFLHSQTPRPRHLSRCSQTAGVQMRMGLGAMGPQRVLPQRQCPRQILFGKPCLGTFTIYAASCLVR